MTARDRRIITARAGLRAALADLAASQPSPRTVVPGRGQGETMTSLEIALAGRVSMLETLICTLLAHTAGHYSSPPQFLSQVLADTERSLSQAHAQASGAAALEAAAALEGFSLISQRFLAHICQHAAPAARV